METNSPDQENSHNEVYLNGLLVRISGLEKEQKLSREQIQRLAADKKHIKEMLHNLAKEKNNIKNRHEQQESMNASLIIEIQNKSLEEKKLRQQVEQIQKQAEEEIKCLKEERDAALALIEGRTTKQPFYQQYYELIFITVLICTLLFSVSIWLLI
jgi:alanyl-tRNA synthetase